MRGLLFFISVVFFVATSVLPSANSLWIRITTTMQVTMVSKVFSTGTRLRSILFAPVYPDSVRELLLLNQKLASAVTSTRSATFQEGKKSVQLSKSVFGWIILAGQRGGIVSGGVLTQNGVYFGSVSRVASGYSTVDSPLEKSGNRLPVQHLASGVLGYFDYQAGEPWVYFFQEPSMVQQGDIIATSPDGVHVRTTFPVGAIASQSAQRSSYPVTLFASPLVGSELVYQNEEQ